MFGLKREDFIGESENFLDLTIRSESTTNSKKKKNCMCLKMYNIISHLSSEDLKEMFYT